MTPSRAATSSTRERRSRLAGRSKLQHRCNGHDLVRGHCVFGRGGDNPPRPFPDFPRPAQTRPPLTQVRTMPAVPDNPPAAGIDAFPLLPGMAWPPLPANAPAPLPALIAQLDELERA